MADQKIAIAKEVFSVQAKALELTAELLDHNFSEAVDLFYKTKGRVVLTGMGKSGIIAQKIAATLSSTGTPSVFLHPAEAVHGDLGMIRKGDSVLALSNSGETREILAIVPFIKQGKNPLVSITGNAASSLAQEAEISLLFRIQKEGCPLNLAPMASTTATLALGDALAAALMEKRKFTPRDFSQYHPHGSLGRMLTSVAEVMYKEEAPTVKRETPMPEILDLMVTHNRGAVLVAGSRGHLRGLISDGDLKRILRKFGPQAWDQKAVDIMNETPRYIYDTILIAEAIEFMQANKISVLPVLKSDKKIAGLVQLHELLNYKPS